MSLEGNDEITNLLIKLKLDDQVNNKNQTYFEAFEQYGIDSLDTLLECYDDEDTDLKKELYFKPGHWVKFKKFVKSPQICQTKTNNIEEKIDRETFPDGINVIKSVQHMYQLPEIKTEDLTMNGGKGWQNKVVNVLTCCRDTISTLSLFSKSKKEIEVKAKVTKFNKKMEKLRVTPNHKIILVCGKTGAGKSTLINSMMNYIFNVRHSDKYRLRLIVEKPKQGGQSKSQTDFISTYFIKKPKGSNVNFDLTIVDTPGFGDDRGIQKDQQILESFKYVFNNVLESVSSICFVVKSADNRLESSQTYVFNNILNLWAKNVQENIFILMTFADNKKANCEDALDSHPVLKNCTNRFKINNSAFTDDPTSKDFDPNDIVDAMFFDLGMACFDKFFKALNNVDPKPIEASKLVLKQRDQITEQIHLISLSLDKSLVEQQNMETTKRMIKKYENDINAGKEKVWYNKVLTHKQIPSSNKLITTCLICSHKTCHRGCCVVDKTRCCMMKNGNCVGCGCSASSHTNKSYYWEAQYKNEKQSSWDHDPSIKNRHQKAKNDKSRADRMLQQAEKQIKQIENDINRKIKMIQQLRNQLEKIALRPQLSTVGDHIDKLISNEEENPKKDPEKLKLLRKLKKQEEFIEKLDEEEWNYKMLSN